MPPSDDLPAELAGDVPDCSQRLGSADKALAAGAVFALIVGLGVLAALW